MKSKKFQITTHSLEETQTLGRKMGELIKAETIIALVGGLGSGKTSFVQGLAVGVDVPSDYYVTSPTYTLISEYPGRHPLFHIDLYRLGSNADLEDIGFYEIFQTNSVIAIEWADKLRKDILLKYLRIDIKFVKDNLREICMTASRQADVDLIKNLENQR